MGVVSTRPTCVRTMVEPWIRDSTLRESLPLGDRTCEVSHKAVYGGKVSVSCDDHLHPYMPKSIKIVKLTSQLKRKTLQAVLGWTRNPNQQTYLMYSGRPLRTVPPNLQLVGDQNLSTMILLNSPVQFWSSDHPTINFYKQL